ncbi:MAG: DMT family transporter [Caldilineaceae bacterium]|jgi:drug/metabolite transporter (DMT)-like permease|nr:DMT family transporter [Caldilineaceae bacterium]
MFELSTLLFGLLSAAAWGAGDFCGGLASKRAHVYTVVLVAEFIGALVLAGLALLLGERVPGLTHLLWAGAGGVAGVIGLLALYGGLSSGQMGIVAPLSAVIAAIVPIAASMVAEGWPTPAQLAGFVAALAAVWLLAGGSGRAIARSELGYAALAGLGFGLYFVLIDQATDAGVFWNLAFARTMGGLLLLGIVLATHKPLLPGRAVWPLNIGAGVLDAGGNLFFALAALAGRLDVAAVLASLYPGMTVLLAWAVLGERLNRPQTIGVAAALVAIVLIAV